MLAALLSVFIAANPLASDDAAERLAAVEKWAKGRKPQLSVKSARALTGCVELAAVKETGCTAKPKLCPVREGDDGSSGTRTESLSLMTEEPKALRVWWTAAYDPKVAECDPPESYGSTDSAEQRAKEVATYRKQYAKEYAACVAGMERDAKNDAEELQCDVVLVNACRKEAYVTCKTRNLRQGVAGLDRLHRFAF